MFAKHIIYSVLIASLGTASIQALGVGASGPRFLRSGVNLLRSNSQQQLANPDLSLFDFPEGGLKGVFIEYIEGMHANLRRLKEDYSPHVLLKQDDAEQPETCGPLQEIRLKLAGPYTTMLKSLSNFETLVQRNIPLTLLTDLRNSEQSFQSQASRIRTAAFDFQNQVNGVVTDLLRDTSFIHELEQCSSKNLNPQNLKDKVIRWRDTIKSTLNNLIEECGPISNVAAALDRDYRHLRSQKISEWMSHQNMLSRSLSNAELATKLDASHIQDSAELQTVD